MATAPSQGRPTGTNNMSLPKRIETLISSFTGGITNDPRDERKGMIRMVSNFDILTDAKRIIPYRDTESGDSSASTSQKQNFAIALRTGSTYSLYSLGVKSGAATAEVLYKDLTTGGSADLGDALWSAPSNNQSSAGTGSLDLFTYYKKTGLIYGARAGTHVWAFSPSGSAWADTHQALTYTEVSEGLVHSKDDILYIPYFNAGGLIAKNDNGSWSVTALTLPTYLNPTSICEYGNYLAIGCEPISGIGRSVVFLWDRDSSLATVSEKIDWGEGKLKVLEVIDGVLVGISVNGADQSRINHRITFKYYDGQGAVKFNELLSTTSPILLKRKQKHDGRLFFMLRGTFSGAVREGVWSIGRALVGSPLAISHEQTPNNDTALTDNGVLKGFFKVGDYMLISYVNEASVWSL